MMSNGGRCSWWSAAATAAELGSEAKPHLQSCDESSGSACGSSITFQEVAPHSFIDSSSISWTQALLNGERPETFLSMLQDQELGSRTCIDKQDSPMVSAMDHNFLFQQYSSSCPGDHESINHSSINPSSYGSWPKPLLSQEVNNQLQFIAGNTTTSPWCNINTTTGNSIFHPPTLASSKTTTCGRKMISSVTHDACSSSSAKKTVGDQKRPRVEAASSSPLPPFKVRKEKLGDRVTALQQLVSPFGKTDTASVLQEAIDYINFLHDQVGVLSSPYFKDGLPGKQKQVPNLMQMINEPQPPENRDAAKQLADLRSRGLCLVPISGTYPVAGETAGDFWHPTAALFGGSFR